MRSRQAHHEETKQALYYAKNKLQRFLMESAGRMAGNFLGLGPEQRATNSPRVCINTLRERRGRRNYDGKETRMRSDAVFRRERRHRSGAFGHSRARHPVSESEPERQRQLREPHRKLCGKSESVIRMLASRALVRDDCASAPGAAISTIAVRQT